MPAHLSGLLSRISCSGGRPRRRTEAIEQLGVVIPTRFAPEAQDLQQAASAWLRSFTHHWCLLEFMERLGDRGGDGGGGAAGRVARAPG